MGSLNSGTRLGQYTIVDRLGEGGVAIVYRSRQIDTQHEFAIKVLSVDPESSEEFTRRFEREYQTISELNHPHILKTFGYGQQNDILYLVMELLPGGTLSSLIHKPNMLNPQKIESLLTQISSALSYAHARGIVHRDLKPQNVMLDAHGEAILTDFGIAKVLHDTSTITRTGMIIGTPPYMSPEQWRGESIDARSDVYSLGAMLFEMITGRTPFRADSALSMMHLHVYQPVPSIRRLRPEVPARIEWIINKALAKHRDNRFESADAPAAAFRTVVQEEPIWGAAAPTAPGTPINEKTWILGVQANTTKSPVPAPEQEVSTYVPIGPILAAEQERRALDAMAADSRSSAFRQGTRAINPPPLITQDRFKGRLKESTDVIRLLAERVRLISIYGRGGVGKTALACKVLADLQLATDGSAPDGIIYLSAISTGINLDRILADFGRLLGGNAQTALDALRADAQMTAPQKVSALLDTLKMGHYVLLLDNLETLQNPENGELTDSDLKAFIEAVLTQGGPLTLLVTSRDPLTLRRELKLQERLIPLDQGLQIEDAVALLRASDPDGAAGLRDAPEPTLIRLAEKARGFPRALEAFVGLLLEDSLLDVDALIADARDGPRLDGEVIAVLVQQAIDQLSPSALCVMESLAVYSIPVKQPAIDYLLAPYLDTSTIRPILNRLVRSYFVNFNRAASTFALHPIDRDYCYTNVPNGTPADRTASDETTRYTRHALHWRAANFYERQEKPQDQWKSVDDLAPQLARFDHLVNAEEYDAAARVLTAIDTGYLLVWGQFTRLLTLYERVKDQVSDPKLARKCLFGMGQSCIARGDMAKAIVASEKALESARQSGDQADEGLALNTLGAACLQSGQIERAISHFEQALPISQRLGNRRQEGRQLGNLGTAYWYTGRIDRAIDYYQQAIAIAQQLGDRLAEGNYLGNLAGAFSDSGQYDRALPMLEQATFIARETGDVEGESMYLGNLANARIQTGDYLSAITAAQTSLHLAEQADLPEIKSYSGGYLTTAFLHLGDLPGARRAIERARQVNVPNNNDGAAAIHGMILLRLGERAAAQTAFEDSLRYANDLITEMPSYSKHHFVCGLAHAGLALLTNGDLQPAIDSYTQGQALSKEQGVLSEELYLLESLMACPGGERLAPIHTVLAS